MAERADTDAMKPGHVILLVLALVALAFLGGWFARGARPVPPAPPPVIVHDTLPAPPPVVVTVPTYVHTGDTTSARRVDSLIAASADRERTVDSLAHALARERTSEAPFKAVDPAGIKITGLIVTLCKPLDSSHVHTITLDTIAVPVRIETRVEVDEVLNWKLAAGILIVGVASGVVVHEVLDRPK